MGEREITPPFVFVTPSKAHSLSANLARPGDIVFTQRGTLGQVSLVPPAPYDRYLISQSQMKVTLDRDRVDRRFLLHLFTGPIHQKLIQASTIQTGVPHLNLGVLRRIPCQLPPLPEQRAIAAALSDVDALLASLDRLIAKQRDLKQAAMQQLLTGEKRLPGFSGKWEVRRLGDLFTFLKTVSNSRADLSDSGDVGYIHYGDIHSNHSAFLDGDDDALPRISAKRVTVASPVQHGDLVIADASEDYTGLGKSVEVKLSSSRRVVAGLHTLLLRGDRSALADGFKGYLQFIPDMRAALVRMATGISVYGISKKSVRSVELRLPAVPEQSAIATVLSDMDAEITALEHRREKTRLLKLGMMQQLLTGRTRLV